MTAQWDSSLSVLPVARVMTAQWDSSLSVLPVPRVMIVQWASALSVFSAARAQFLTRVEYFNRFFPGRSHVLPCTQFREYQRPDQVRPLGKESHEDHETDQPGLRETEPNSNKTTAHY